MNNPVVLIHGLWLTPRSWEGWKARFEQRGHEVITPAWPRMDRDVEALRQDPSALNGLGITEIVDHYDRIIRGLDTPPVIMGHSFGGLITELLLDRGLGAAGVAISPAQVKGVLRLPPAQIRTVWPALRNPANINKTVPLTANQFRFRFTNTMTVADSQAAYERYYIPGPGRVLFQAGLASFNPHAVTKVDFHKDDRPPLLVIGNERDLEVAFIALTFGANQHNIPLAAAAAIAAVLVVAVVGIAVRAPLSRVPENSMKFAVGVMLIAFGMFWGAEGAGAHWPLDDAALLVLVPAVALYALALVALFRRRTAIASPVNADAAITEEATHS
jgi:pimeloyl-ACP methyl ester carboxylesterase